MGIIETIKMLEREEGIEIGAELKSREFVANLLRANKFTNAEIANFANVTEAFVEEIKVDLHL